MIEEYFPHPKIELNCRGKARSGWNGWGVEAEEHSGWRGAPNSKIRLPGRWRLSRVNQLCGCSSDGFESVSLTRAARSCPV